MEEQHPSEQNLWSVLPWDPANPGCWLGHWWVPTPGSRWPLPRCHRLPFDPVLVPGNFIFLFAFFGVFVSHLQTKRLYRRGPEARLKDRHAWCGCTFGWS